MALAKSPKSSSSSFSTMGVTAVAGVVVIGVFAAAAMTEAIGGWNVWDDGAVGLSPPPFEAIIAGL